MNTLQELVEAIQAGTIVDVTAFVDNDVVSFYEADGEASLLDLHPHELQLQALHLLGVKAESV